jgi:predicted phosphoadenosine phosphosulfate sulfurtransferase
MSSNYWQIKKQQGQYKPGKTVTQKIQSYIDTWERRCYPEGIPDEVPNGLMDSHRVPSYKAIAIAILKNDLNFLSLGFEPKVSKYYEILKNNAPPPVSNSTEA